METITKKVFLIEDDFAIIDVYGMAFDAAGIHFESITLGQVALKKIKNIQEGKEEKPALVLLDLMLPDINGLEILLTLRDHDAPKDIPVYILSNDSSQSLLNMQYIKPDKYIVKTSITPTQLVELVKEQLKK